MILELHLPFEGFVRILIKLWILLLVENFQNNPSIVVDNYYLKKWPFQMKTVNNLIVWSEYLLRAVHFQRKIFSLDHMRHSKITGKFTFYTISKLYFWNLHTPVILWIWRPSWLISQSWMVVLFSCLGVIGWSVKKYMV